MEGSPDDKIKGLRLFDDIERTHQGTGDNHEPLFRYLNRSARSGANQARKLSDGWFDRYKQDVSESEINKFRARFRNDCNIHHYSTWFELLVHQLLVRLGASIRMHPDLLGTSNHPDFIADMDKSRIIVEATVVAPDDDPSEQYERDAIEKLDQLKSEVFWVWIEEIQGTLTCEIPEKRILPKLQRFLSEHDPDQVQEMIDMRGHHTAPRETIEFENWKMTVSLCPMGPEQRGSKKSIVSGPIWAVDYGRHVSSVQRKIRRKAKRYGQVQDPFIIALNYYSRDGSFDLDMDAKDALFGRGGVWGTSENPHFRELSGVLFFKDTNSYCVPSTKTHLYINPFAPLDIISRIPKSLYRFSHVNDGKNLIQGESVPSLLGLP